VIIAVGVGINISTLKESTSQPRHITQNVTAFICWILVVSWWHSPDPNPMLGLIASGKVAYAVIECEFAL
jgi:hypothetical protein